MLTNSNTDVWEHENAPTCENGLIELCATHLHLFVCLYVEVALSSNIEFLFQQCGMMGWAGWHNLWRSGDWITRKWGENEEIAQFMSRISSGSKQITGKPYNWYGQGDL